MTDYYATVKALYDRVLALETELTAMSAEVNKIDSAATDGLAGTEDSLAYRVHEIEAHNHHWGTRMGKAASPSGETNIADRIGPGIAAFQLDAGNATWGNWTQILGSSDTPARSGMVKYDLNKIAITSAEKAAVYFIQFAFGATGADALTAGTYTELVFESDTVGAKNTGVTYVTSKRVDAGTKMWGRCLCLGENTATIDFYVGLHEYVG